MILPVLLLVFWSFTQVANGITILKKLDVRCGHDEMTVHISFHSPFDGIIFSSGHYDDKQCHYVRHRSGRREYRFTVPLHGCGTTSHVAHPTDEVDKYIENTLIIQEDPYIQGMDDMARNVRCVWRHTFSKVVTARPMSFNSVPLIFTRQSINRVTPLHLDSGPFDYPVSGYIYMGEETSMVVYIQDPSHVFDANVKGCQMVDKKGRKMLSEPDGCYSAKNMLTPFYKTNSTGDSGATMMFYSYFQGYKPSEQDEFLINCELEVCPGKCSSTCSNPVVTVRKKREVMQIDSGSQDVFFKDAPNLLDTEQKTDIRTRIQKQTRNEEILHAEETNCPDGSIVCAPWGWLIAIAAMSVLSVLLILISAVLCCKLSKHNKFLVQKLSTDDKDLLVA